MEINFQNEWIVAWLDGEAIAMSPDLICVLDTVSGNAFGTETIRYGMRAASAILQSRMPWCSVIVRKVFGVAGALHQNSSRYGMRMAWPSAEWGSLPIAVGYSSTSAPSSIIARAHSGNHWSQQMPAPMDCGKAMSPSASYEEAGKGPV